MKTVGRVALIAIAAAMLCWMTGAYAATGPGSHRYHERNRTVRPSEPDMRRLPNFVGQFVLVGLIAVGGRVILRLRLG